MSHWTDSGPHNSSMDLAPLALRVTWSSVALAYSWSAWLGSMELGRGVQYTRKLAKKAALEYAFEWNSMRRYETDGLRQRRRVR